MSQDPKRPLNRMPCFLTSFLSIKFPAAIASAFALVVFQPAARAEDTFPSLPPSATSAPAPASSPSVSQIPLKVFFPPDPLVFGAPYTTAIPLPGRMASIAIDAPPTLADYVSEDFYAPLSTRLWIGNLASKLQSHLDAYLAARTDLINELREKLALMQNSDPASREQELSAFALIQTPRIVALEKSAELLRVDILRGSLLAMTIDWNQDREWILGVDASSSPAQQLAAEFNVIRAAAYYQDGLSVEQRGLLREISIELKEQARAARRGRGLRSGDDTAFAMFFSPATARLHLPVRLPSALVAKIGIFNHDRDALKAELRDALRSTDGASDSKRTKALTALAENQRPRFSALENLAEEIRRGLAVVPAPPLPALPPLIPPALAQRIESYRLDSSALRQERNARLSDDLAHPAPATLRERIAGTTPSDSSDRSSMIQKGTAQGLERMNQADKAFLREAAGRYADLSNRLEAIHRESEALARLHIDPVTHQPFDATALIRAIDLSNQQFDQLGREETIFANYRIAMLVPGLSPEQRRLLLGAALVELAQPLPAGEPLPHGTIIPLIDLR